jgi:hypothetical protein
MYEIVGKFVASFIVGFLSIGLCMYFLFNGFTYIGEQLKLKHSIVQQILLGSLTLAVFAVASTVISFVGINVIRLFGSF